MRVLCRHGHFAFYPRKAGDIARFSNSFGMDLVPEEDYYTFEGLQGADDYSLVGKIYLNLPALAMYEGKPWEIMRENNYVYSLALGLIVPKLTILGLVDLTSTGFYYVASGALIQPGVRTMTGQQVLSYSGEFVEEGFGLRVLEFDYE